MKSEASFWKQIKLEDRKNDINDINEKNKSNYHTKEANSL